MPFRQVDDLPERVRDHLPKHAQEIYLKAFNSAWDQYQDPAKRRGQENLEETAHKVAWSAVEREYVKDEQSGDSKRKNESA